MLNNTGGVIQLDGTFLTLQGPLIFTKIVSDSAIVYVGSSSITLANQITFSGNQARYCIVTDVFLVEEYTSHDIVANDFSAVFYKINNLICLFQYMEAREIFLL